ncbi:P-loop containing nucleoside triphosphate hydrolase protein [Trichoderma sp. SZMC 28013]
MASRAYQIEMLEQSVERNVIVAMDTGSGKTQVAVLRIKKELEACDPKQIIWFIAPTISLCSQQHDVLKLHIPTVSMMMLAGASNINAWGPDIWSTLLDTARVVISTPQILLDALDHAYITMNHLALIVFDEAHNCVGKNPGGKVMTNHYHPRKQTGQSVPSILGLTATPSIQSEKEGLEALEILLDARCISPTLHRDELLKCVKRPTISHVIYNPGREDMTPTMRSLNQVYLDLDIREDPYIHQLLRDPTDKNKRKLAEAIEKYDTYTQNQMKSFCSRSKEICKQLGPWAADLYIWKAISAHLNKVEGDHDLASQWWVDAEKKYLAQVYRRVNVQPPPETPQAFDDISDKVGRLLSELLSTQEHNVGIIFVEERVMVTMLYEILSINQAIKAKYKIGTMVGTSAYATRRKAMYEFGEKADYKDLLSFRQGKINLLIATSVLEEGIDVPACNLVICFDTPTTSKSFIQRRGRARKKDSRLVIFFERANPALQKWEEKEEEIKKLFDDEQREFRELSQLEEGSENPNDIFFIVPSTQARLDFDNAKAHLEHFCRVLSPGEFVDSRPDYIIHQEPESRDLRCTVLLPPYLPTSLRKHSSASAWQSEKNATKDAAYQAYRALFDAELVNDNLQPFKASDMGSIDSRASEVLVEPMMKPWHHVAKEWRNESSDKWLYSLTCIGEDGQVTGEYEVLLPVQIHQPQPLQMYLDRSHKMELRLSAGTPVPHNKITDLPDQTSTLLALHFGHRWPIEPVEHVIRAWAKGESLSMDQIGERAYDPESESVKQGQYLIRDNTKSPYTYKDTLGFKPAITQVQHAFYEYEKAPEDVPYLVLNKWTRRTDFLHRLHGDPGKEQASSRPYSRVYPSQWAKVDTIPAKHAQFGMMIPTIIHELGVMIMARELAKTVLWDVDIKNLELVREALSARSAAEPVNYERVEFLGDSILKFFTCIRVAAQYPDYPEGYLSHKRDRLISNSRLYKTAINYRLPRFLITKPFTGQKWRPLYLDAILQEEDTEAPIANRKVSTKTLADMVEALIGVSYIDGSLDGGLKGGLHKAVKCLSTFLPETNWTSVEEDRHIMFDRVPEGEPLPSTLEPVERLIEYSFQKKALLIEALTHASFAAEMGKRSFERLEFIGDAILDNIIVTKLFDVKPELPHFRMHTLKTGMVNGDFLAFMTMEHGLKSTEPTVGEDGNVKTVETISYLWSFMRQNSEPIVVERKETMKRHAALREEILDAMENGTHYPWALLAALNPKKFFSDVFEAILGAVWVDSGSMDACKAIADRFGLLKYLDRLLRDEVHVQHPKEELGKWANTETVTYELDMRESEQNAAEKEFFCKVLVGKREVVAVRGGINKEEVKTKAATEAMKILEREKRNGEDVEMGE